jgi:hypothetical protein
VKRLLLGTLTGVLAAGLVLIAVLLIGDLRITNESGGITNESGGITNESGGITNESGGMPNLVGESLASAKIEARALGATTVSVRERCVRPGPGVSYIDNPPCDPALTVVSQTPQPGATLHGFVALTAR